MPSKAKYKEAYKVPKDLPEVKRLKDGILILETMGCSCDLLYGYRCDIHRFVRNLLKEY
jgi:hypothetical protein